jgi:hypothetical protein
MEEFVLVGRVHGFLLVPCGALPRNHSCCVPVIISQDELRGRFLSIRHVEPDFRSERVERRERKGYAINQAFEEFTRAFAGGRRLPRGCASIQHVGDTANSMLNWLILQKGGRNRIKSCPAFMIDIVPPEEGSSRAAWWSSGDRVGLDTDFLFERSV